MMQTDVKSAQLGATQSVPYRTRLKGILISSTGSGVIDLKDGNGGNTLFSFNALEPGNVYVAIPGEGILFENSIYANTVTGSNITVFYG